MTYNDIVVPIQKHEFGEADTIFTFLSANHGKISAIAKGIRRINSRKRGNIEYGAFSRVQLGKGKNMDIVLEAEMIDFNESLYSPLGLKFLYKFMPLLNKFSTDDLHSEAVFNIMKDIFVGYTDTQDRMFEVKAKYEMLELQNLLPNFKLCTMCNIKYENLDKFASKSGHLICNNCARKVESQEIRIPKDPNDIFEMSPIQLASLLIILNYQIKHHT